MAKTIADYKKDYEDARKRGDAAGMQAANDGANAIRRQQGQKEEKATQDIKNTANKSSSTGSGRVTSSSSSSKSSSSSRRDDDDDDDRSSSRGTYDPTRPQGAQYNGPYGDTPIRPLDDHYREKEAYYKQKYETARQNGDVEGMRAANDGMNQVRNDYGLAAQYAHDDINYMKGQTGYGKAEGGYSSIGGGGSGGSSGGGTPDYGQLQGQTEDLSAYLEELYAAQRRAAIAGIRSAYDKNLSAIDRSAIGMDTKYQNARNQTAGASELAKRNFAEYAAATGLNSGAGGQAELSRNVTLQNNLNALDQDEADFYSNIELQKAQAEQEYNNAIAQAEASGDAAKAQALYEEKVRVQEALRQQELQQIQLDMQRYQIELQQKQYQDSIRLGERESLAGYGETFLQQGLMPSQEMLDAMGITAQDAQSFIDNLGRVSTEPTLTYTQMMDAIERGQTTPAVLAAWEHYMGSGYDGYRPADKSKGTKTGPGYGVGDYDTFFEAAMDSGSPQSFIANSYKNYGFTSSSGLYDDYTKWEAGLDTGAYNDSNFRAAMNSLVTMLQQDPNTALGGIDSMWGKLSARQKMQVQDLLARYGYTYQG